MPAAWLRAAFVPTVLLVSGTREGVNAARLAGRATAAVITGLLLLGGCANQYDELKMFGRIHAPPDYSPRPQYQPPASSTPPGLAVYGSNCFGSEQLCQELAIKETEGEAPPLGNEPALTGSKQIVIPDEAENSDNGSADSTPGYSRRRYARPAPVSPEPSQAETSPPAVRRLRHCQHRVVTNPLIVHGAWRICHFL